MMTQDKFWELFESERINYKIFSYENPSADNGELALGEVIAFEYEGKYYLRVCENYSPRGYRRRYKNGGWSWAVIKEFDTKQQANKYFVKAFSKYHRA